MRALALSLLLLSPNCDPHPAREVREMSVKHEAWCSLEGPRDSLGLRCDCMLTWREGKRARQRWRACE